MQMFIKPLEYILVVVIVRWNANVAENGAKNAFDKKKNSVQQNIKF